tara:strand:+ start:116 stop:523 length:408 start_codon:yes stop_codon:yes gene_type:complete
MNNINDSHKTQLSTACLLLSVAEADEILEKQELDIIQDILKDFFSIEQNDAHELIHEAQDKMKNATGLFEFGQHLNSIFDHADKLDFISCVFEVAYADGNLHYLEHHTVKKIANILNISREDVLTSKVDMDNFLD